MNKNQWQAFCNFRKEFKLQCESWSALAPDLKPLQKQAASNDTPDYEVETPVVYNLDLDKFTQDSDIRLIVTGDNPGKNEQLAANRRYLVGQAGKIAEGFFRRNKELGIDFRKNVLILNKTPVHTAKTAHLRCLVRSGDDRILKLIEQSQIWMAKKTAQLHQALFENLEPGTPKLCRVQLWLVGYAELKGNGIFLPYKNALFSSYKEHAEVWHAVRVYQHFSMNRFSIDLNSLNGSQHPGTNGENRSFQTEKLDLSEADTTPSMYEKLQTLGAKHRTEIFGN